jgi:predicted amidophosphoribosyltransferase
VRKIEEKSFKTCPHCKHQLLLSAKFCRNCGKKVEEDQVIPSKKEEGKVDRTRKYCPHCGQHILLGAKFCRNCGKKLEQDEEAPIQSEESPEIAPDYQPPPPISELIKDTSSQIPETETITPKVEKVPLVPVVSEKKEEKVKLEVPHIKPEEIQPSPPISEKIEEKIIELPYYCKFCGMELNKKAIYCPQCGTRVKKK